MTRIATLLGLATLLVLPAAQGAVTENELAELRAQIAALTERVRELEQGRGPVAATVPSVVASGGSKTVVQDSAAANWTQRIEIQGDFRYRHELIDEEGLESRSRQRIRARSSVTAQLTEDLEVGLQIASGDDDPVSTNQTLGDGGSTKDINLDLAYFDWNLPAAGTHVRGGKFENTLHRVAGTQLIWDGDWHPEGLSIHFDNGSLFGTATGVWAEERSAESDSLIFSVQLGGHVDIGASELTLGAGYYDIGNTQGEEPFFDGDPRGNSVDANGNYLFDFEEVELFAELKSELGNLPLTVFADYVRNLDADEFDTGYAIGAVLGKAKAPGSWQAGYEYRDLEADAVLALFSDSDFAGGGTDGSGHILTGRYAAGQRWNLQATYFINERGADAGSKRDYDRLQLDANFKY